MVMKLKHLVASPEQKPKQIKGQLRNMTRMRSEEETVEEI